MLTGHRLFAAFAAGGALLLTACATTAPAVDSAVVSAEPAHAALAADAVRVAMTADEIPALAVAVSRHGALVWSEAFGVADLENDLAATRNTKFRLGSVSKLLTADLAAIMAEEGTVDLDTDVRTYVPAFPDKGAPVTLRQLLGHLGGVRHYLPKDRDGAAPGGPIDVRLYTDAASVLAIFADDPLVAAPGEKYHYTTFGYSLIGLALEAAAQKPFPVLVREKILAPAGIDDIVVDDHFAVIPGRAGYYDQTADYRGLLPPARYGTVVNALPLNSAYKIPGGGYAGDAEAVAAFGALHLAPGFFSEAAYAELFRPQTTNAGDALPVALGWRVGEDADGRRLFQHSGSQQGGRAHLAVWPDDGLVVAFLTNMGGRPRDSAGLAQEIAAPFLTAAD